MTTSTELWTLVQHSGFGYAGKHGFSYAVEEVRVQTPREADKIRKAGGVIFSSYSAASDAAMIENYPPEIEGIYPSIRGEFHKTTCVRGLRLYLPARALVSMSAQD